MKNTKSTPTTIEVTQDLIESWKEQYGAITKIAIEDKAAYFKMPDRKTLSFATVAGGTKDPFKFNEIILESCFIGGDRELIESDEYFLTMSGQVSELIQIKTAELTKL